MTIDAASSAAALAATVRTADNGLSGAWTLGGLPDQHHARGGKNLPLPVQQDLRIGRASGPTALVRPEHQLDQVRRADIKLT
ncbi:hypothetical protein GCM10011411_08360 [Aurantiacibacter arachoides]|nr:hypothetical protein GCM10011411_08360 [Aurantiacibacter arachoides]